MTTERRIHPVPPPTRRAIDDRPRQGPRTSIVEGNDLAGGDQVLS
jgi:hypothetical protein